MPFLRCEGEDGRQHVVRLEEWIAGLHRVRVYANGCMSSCVCDPRVVQGVVVHRQMTIGALYAPWERGGH
jgi:hypothetical protein